MSNLKNPVIVEIIIYMYGRNQSWIMLCFERIYKHLRRLLYILSIFIYCVTENNRKTSNVSIMFNISIL